MTIETMEERLTAVEREVAQFKQRALDTAPPAPLPWWEKIASTFAQSEHYDEAMRLGREYREAQRPTDDEETG